MKPQNKRKGRRVLAAALTLSLTMGMFSGVHVLAEDPLSEASPSLNQEFWTPSMEEPLPNTKGELSLEELAAAELAEADIPAAVSAEEIAERGHVHRLREQEENLYSIVFQNRDGTKTLYYFAEEVKYIDEDGVVRDKKNTLTELDGVSRARADGYRYVNDLNDIRTYFPADLNADTGLVLEHDGVRIELTPEYARRSESEQASEEDAKKETEAPALSDALLSENADDGNAAETESALTQASSEPSDGDGAESSRTKESLSLLPEESLPSASAPSTENTGTEPPVSNTTAAAPTVPTVPAASIEPTGQTEPDETEASATAAVPSDSISSAVPAEPIMGEAFAKPAEPERVDAIAARGEKKALSEGSDSSDAVEYSGVFGAGTTLRYTPAFSGVKEDILLTEDPGVNEFSFILETGGLSLIREGETVLLIDPLTGERVAMLDNILVFDSSAPSAAEETEEIRTWHHYYRMETVEPDARYRVTLVVDEEYLSAPSTVYPVVVDPSLSFISSGDGLQDATIYDHYLVNEGNSGSVFVGNYSARYGGTRGCARTLVKLPAGALYSIKASQVTSAKLYYRDLMCEADVTRIDCYTMNYDWNESTVTCSTQLWNGYGSLLSQADVGGANGTDGVGGPAGGYWYDFDITDAAKSWINTGKYYGVMLRANFESQASRTFASAQRGSYQPRLVVEYNADHVAVSQICLNTTSLTMTLNDTAYLTAKVLPSNATNRQVTWESSNPDVVSVGGSGMLCAKKAGSATITVRAKDNSAKIASCKVTVNKLKIYQTTNTKYFDENWNLAEDLYYGDKTSAALEAAGVPAGDYVGVSAEEHRFFWETMCKQFFATEPLETVILDMIDHFMKGTGNDYSNSVLTQKILEHPSTQTYINSITKEVNSLLPSLNGDINALIYSQDKRDDNPLIKRMKDEKIREPVYNTDDDRQNGLTICVDSLWGNMIEVTSYVCNGKTYSGTLHFTLYDHFGLDASDISKYGFLRGFTSWYILQHYDAFNKQFKPFLTVIEFDAPFSGNL